MGSATYRGDGAMAQKRISESDAALAQLIASNADTAAYQIAEVYAYRGDNDETFEWLERARQQRDCGLVSMRRDPLLVNLDDDARWNHFLHSVGPADNQVK